MPRDSRPAVAEHNSLVAAATRFPVADSTRIYNPHRPWQDEAWRHYDICGELRFAANWIGNVMSRATLFAAVRKDGQVTRDGVSSVATDALETLFGGPNGQPQMMQSLGMHLTVVGEAYLVQRSDPNGDGYISEIVASKEMRHVGKDWWIDHGDGRKIELTDDDTVVRVWRPHPVRYLEADSPVRAVLPILREIELLTRHVDAQATSRLAGAGILFLPSEMSFPTPTESTGNAASDFMQVIGTAMMESLKNPGSAEATVPVTVTTPADNIDKIKHMTFWSALDEHSVELRQEAIRRFALGMDIPPEVLLGTDNMNHWGAWQMEESSIKAHIEPLLALVSNALSVGYLQPITDSRTDVVAFDTSAIRLRPNRSKEALELYDRGQLKGETLRRETGFSPDDEPSADEMKEWFTRKVASGSTTPELVAEALNMLGLNFPVPQGTGYGPTEAPSSPSMLEHPRRELPAPQAALVASSEMLVLRALERAGNRLKSMTGVRPPGVQAVDLYRYVTVKESSLDRLMDDAWSMADRVLDNSETVVQALDAYCRNLLLSQSEHDRGRMVQYLSAAQEGS